MHEVVSQSIPIALWIIASIALCWLLQRLFFGILAYGYSGGYKERVFMIVGPSGSGKTSLFYSLFSKATDMPITQLSLKPNQAQLPLGGLLDHVEDKDPSLNSKKDSSVRLVDTPGHAKLFQQWTRHCPKTASQVLSGIIFLIDTVNISKELRLYADQLFQVMTDPIVNPKDSNIPILVCCTKTDLAQSAPVGLVRASLIGELHNILTVKRNSGSSIGDLGHHYKSDQEVEEDSDKQAMELQTRLDILEERLRLLRQASFTKNILSGEPIQFIPISLVNDKKSNIGNVAKWISSVILLDT
jgi:signal recognition particle receptor subunit beta